MRIRQTDPRMGRTDAIARPERNQKIGVADDFPRQNSATAERTAQETRTTNEVEHPRGIGRATMAATGGPRLRLFTTATLGLLIFQTGCMGPMLQSRSVAYIEPPREKLQASLTNDRIKVSDVLEFTLTDGSTVSLNGTYKVDRDGAVELAGYGKVQVAGKTLEEAKQAVRDAMAAKSVIQAAFEMDRSEYYLVTVTADGLQDLTRVPLGVKTTVKDAVTGIPRLSHKVIWIVRPMLDQSVKEQVLAIDWDAISRLDDHRSNYVLKPGDWLFVADEPSTGFGRFFGALTSMFSLRKSGAYDPPPSADKPSKKQFYIDDIDNPAGERI